MTPPAESPAVYAIERDGKWALFSSLEEPCSGWSEAPCALPQGTTEELAMRASKRMRGTLWVNLGRNGGADWGRVLLSQVVPGNAAPEEVDHPAHYGGKDDPYEAIKVIDAWELSFCLGNTVKYIRRAGEKPGHSALKDLKKARWYLDHEIETLERGT